MDNKEDKQPEDIHLEHEDLDDSVVSEESAAETVKKLREKLKEAETKAGEYLSGWQRAQADFINYKKRESREREDFLKTAAEPAITDIVAVLDDFDAAFSNKAEWEKVDKGWRDGVERIYARMKSILEKHGVAVIDPIGQEFDPSVHLAVQMTDTEKSQDGKVVEVVHKGYKLSGKVIRPAKVKVGQMRA